jgi:hypothetical protein
VLLEWSCHIEQSHIAGKGLNSILEVNEVEDEVLEKRKLRVVLTLLNHHIILEISLEFGVVLEDLGEADLVTV